MFSVILVLDEKEGKLLWQQGREREKFQTLARTSKKAAFIYIYNALKNIEEIIKNLKADADAILSYMASNGLVANAKKMVFMILNLTKAECKNQLVKEISINNCIVERSVSTKLLGLIIDEKHNWKEQIAGSNGLTNALNYRTFALFFHSIDYFVHFDNIYNSLILLIDKSKCT